VDARNENTWQVGFLPSLSSDAQERLLSLAETFQHGEDEVIFHQNDPSLNLYIVKSGVVAIEIYRPTRGFCRMLELGPGELFSWSALIEPRRETATARALENTCVFGIAGGKLIDNCLKDPAFGYEIYKGLANVISTRLKATRREVLEMRAAS